MGQIGSFRGSEASAAMGLWQAEQSKISTDAPGHLAALPSPRRLSADVRGLGAETQASADKSGRGLGLAARRQAKGAGVWNAPQLGVVQDGVWVPIVNAK